MSRYLVKPAQPELCIAKGCGHRRDHHVRLDGKDTCLSCPSADGCRHAFQGPQ